MFETMWTKRAAISKERMAICEACEHYKPATTQCEQCGCFMVGKTKFLSSECPIGKWKAVDES
jgi:hypothetical protein